MYQSLNNLISVIGHDLRYVFYASFTDVNTNHQSQLTLTTRHRHLFKAHLHCPVTARLHRWATVPTTATVAMCRCVGAVCVSSTLTMRLPVVMSMIQVCVDCVLSYQAAFICSLV